MPYLFESVQCLFFPNRKKIRNQISTETNEQTNKKARKMITQPTSSKDNRQPHNENIHQTRHLLRLAAGIM